MRKRSYPRGYAGVVSVLLFSLILGGSALAQSGTAIIRGRVIDPQGNAVAGATVTLTSTQTNAARTQTTNESGGYVFTQIEPGTYRVDVEAGGFKKGTVPEVRALVDTPANVDVPLEVGNVSETVTVSAGTNEVLLNTQDATIGNTFVESQIKQLPLNARNVVGLLSLQAAVTPNSDFTGTGGAVAGARGDQSNLTLDGIDVNEQQEGTAFQPVLRVTPDSVQEFRVTVTNPNAVQGRSSGAQVSLLTKSGTNEFHGSLYEFHRNTVTTANDFFNNKAGRHVATDLEVIEGRKRVGEKRVERPKLIRNLFGGSIGGPIQKDRLFFFYNYEGRRDAAQGAVTTIVPLASLGRGEVKYVNKTGGVTTLTTADITRLFPQVGVNPAAVAVLADAARRYPANDFTVGDKLNTAGFRFNATTPVKQNVHTARFDYNPAANHTLFLRGVYQYDTETLFAAGGAPLQQFPDTPSPQQWNHPYGIATGHTWTVTPTVINRFTYGLTRQAFSNQGDSDQNGITFRFVFLPLGFNRTLSRTTPVHNFADDVSWVKGEHNFQFGANIRVIRNNRVSFANSFDAATTNATFYEGSGAILTNPLTDIGGDRDSAANALAAVIGRFSQYTANFNFNADGSVLGSGEGVGRTFATEEYEGYFQDTWQLRQNLTLTLGLRYGINTPVYETNGLQVKPTVSLAEFFERRKAGAAAGDPVNDPITLDLAGPANDRPGFYPIDKNNFQPRIAAAWSPGFKEGWLATLFGANGESVLRGGFGITYDRIGSRLAVSFDLNNALGFSSGTTIAANTYNLTDKPAPLFTGFDQDIRSLPRITVPSRLQFPLTHPVDGARRIESSLDDQLTTPVNYSWDFAYERTLKGGFVVTASYIGRAARNLLATRDVMTLNNLVDPRSGLDWYTAANMLYDLRLANTPVLNVQPIAYFENLFPTYRSTISTPNGPVLLTPTQRAYRLYANPSAGGLGFLPDWTDLQDRLDDFYVGGEPAFFHPQWGTLNTFSTFADSDYHAGAFTVRQRFKDHLFFDLNYTLSKSIDNASGLQNTGFFGAGFAGTGGALILNPLRPDDSRAVSDFDMRHIINANALWQLPVGRGKAFLSDSPALVDALIGGWQLSSIFRWNSGLPISAPSDQNFWATNWNTQSRGTRIRDIETSPTKSNVNGEPNLFVDPVAAYRSFRNARPGETGERNILRRPGFVTVDMGLAKSFKLPFEGHALQFRWEVFNVTNTQRMGAIAGGRGGYGIGPDPFLATSQPNPSFGNFVSIQGTPRIMQFALRYDF